VLWGDQDGFCSRSDQDEFVDTIPDCRSVVFPGVGHSVHWEQPGRVAAEVQAFLEELGL
jgi:pimeloyl-ACP methyl ester carboxylesterase